LTVRIGLPTILIVLALIAGAGALGHRFYQQHYGIEERDGKLLAGVVTAAFTGRSDLRVGNVSGTLQAKAEDVNSLGLRSVQVIKAPFSVDYFVDLSNLSLDDYRWDERGRTLTIRLAPVTIGRVNVDESRRTMVRTKGWWVGRGAAERLNQRVSANAQQAAKAEAAKPEHIARARERARAATVALIRPALVLAGLGDVRVVAAFRDDAAPATSDRWDVTRSLREVLADPRYAP
jgi:hypothetical protein